MDTYALQRHNTPSKNTFLLCDGCIKRKNINMYAITSSNIDEMKQIQETLMRTVGIKQGVLHYHNSVTHNDYCTDCYESLSQSQKGSLKPVIR